MERERESDEFCWKEKEVGSRRREMALICKKKNKGKKRELWEVWGKYENKRNDGKLGEK